MKRILWLTLSVLLALAACTRQNPDSGLEEEGDDYITLHYVKWARQPVTCRLGGAEESAPAGFSAPTADQLKKLISVDSKYYGSYKGIKGVLFSARDINGFVPAIVADDGRVHDADYNRYTFTDEHLAHAVFLPVNDGWDGYYWGNCDGIHYNYMHFSMIEMKTGSVVFGGGTGARLFTLEGGMLPVKD